MSGRFGSKACESFWPARFLHLRIWKLCLRLSFVRVLCMFGILPVFFCLRRIRAFWRLFWRLVSPEWISVFLRGKKKKKPVHRRSTEDWIFLVLLCLLYTWQTFLCELPCSWDKSSVKTGLNILGVNYSKTGFTSVDHIAVWFTVAVNKVSPDIFLFISYFDYDYESASV